jgi:hypothetical protein
VAVALDRSLSPAPSAWHAATGGSYTVNLFTLAAGWYYVHLQAKDSSGNTALTRYGPFCAPKCGEAPGPGAASAPRQVLQQAESDLAPIVLDGELSLEAGEWDPATQRMGRDSRPEPPQELFATWDVEDLYFGWRGSLWDRDGQAWVYLDLAPGGSTEPVDGRDLGLPELPIEADLALHVDGDDVGAVLRNAGGSWSEFALPGFGFAHGADGDTELRLPRSAAGGPGPYRWLALSTGHGGGVEAVLPTANPIEGPWTYAYRWENLDPARVPNAGQPGSHHLRVELDSPLGPLAMVGPGQEFPVRIGVENVAAAPAGDVTLDLGASPELELLALAGGPPLTPMGPGRWHARLGSVPAEGRTPMTATLRVAGELGGRTALTVTAALSVPVPAAEPDVSRAELALRVDAAEPHVRIWEPQPAPGTSLALVPSGEVTVAGTAADAGSGLARVEVRVGTGNWRAADGGHAWSTRVNLRAGGRVELAVRAVDGHGLDSAPVTMTLVADDAPPQATAHPVPELVTGRTFVARGLAEDGAGQGVEHVWVQVDEGPWQHVPGPYVPDAGGRLQWDAPLALATEEGVEHRLRARAVDVAGNEGPPSEAVTFVVDNVGPRTDIQVPTAATLVTGDSLLVWGYAVDGVAVESVSVSADGGGSWHPALLGAEAVALIDGLPQPGRGPFRAYLPFASLGEGDGRWVGLWALRVPLPAGPVALRSRAVDEAGNVERLAPPLRLLRGGERWPPRAWLPWLGSP